jgi:hypothetical protein
MTLNCNFKAGIRILALRISQCLLYKCLKTGLNWPKGHAIIMHVRLSCNRIDGKLTDPHMLWWQEFPEWLQRLSGRKEHVRHMSKFWVGLVLWGILPKPQYFDFLCFWFIVTSKPKTPVSIQAFKYRLYPGRIRQFRIMQVWLSWWRPYITPFNYIPFNHKMLW